MADEGLAPDLAAALAINPSKLTPYRGRDVIGVAIEIPGASGGLRDALKFDPVEVDIDEERVLVMKIRCTKHRFQEVKDTDALRLVMVFEPLDDLTAFIDEELVKDVLQEQAERVRLAREAAAGVQRLVKTGPDGGAVDDDGELEEAEALIGQHNLGVHADGLRDGCPLCRDEESAMAEEAAEPAQPTPIKRGRKRT